MTDIPADREEPQEESGSEAHALADIVAWSEDWPEWQRDALRRLYTKGDLEAADLDELTAQCKSNGQGSVPLAAEHIPDLTAAATIVDLKAVHSTRNINALKPGERLTFDKVGLTIVYGDNGSGKSGYARVLKKVCRARTGREGDKILHNIYAPGVRSQEAVIDFRVDGQNKSVHWTTGNPGDPLLSAISVFDSRTANIHVDEMNDVAYTPFPMRILDRLAKACQEIKSRISADIRELEQQTPQSIARFRSHDRTAVARLIARLDGETKAQDVRGLAMLDDKEKALLDTLRIDLGTESANVARRIEALRKGIETFNTVFQALQTAVSEVQVERLSALRQEYLTAKAGRHGRCN